MFEVLQFLLEFFDFEQSQFNGSPFDIAGERVENLGAVPRAQQIDERRPAEIVAPAQDVFSGANRCPCEGRDRSRCVRWEKRGEKIAPEKIDRTFGGGPSRQRDVRMRGYGHDVAPTEMAKPTVKTRAENAPAIHSITVSRSVRAAAALRELAAVAVKKSAAVYRCQQPIVAA